ncbi:MAG: GDP-mannose 4,6-dehydratase, partial [Chloroflexi bacterium]|nr:GDP-mannose 4,6-dehydratase [Chloroflexota bacterium]
VILNALSGKPLPVYGDGRQIRDWLYVADHCEAIYLILKRGAPGETYNIGGDNQPSNLTIVETVCDLLDEIQPQAESRRRLIQFVADRPGHDRRYAMNISKIERELGWKPRRRLTDGLRETVLWFIKNPQWVEAIQKQREYQSWLSKNYEGREKSS